jgi:hypothetical protein
MTKKHRVSFIAKKKVAVPVDVEFETKKGEDVTFEAHKNVKKPVRVSFSAKNKKARRFSSVTIHTCSNSASSAVGFAR